MNYDSIRMYILGSPRTTCVTGPTGLIVRSRYRKNILALIGIVAIVALLVLTTDVASYLANPFGMGLLAIMILLSLTTRKFFVFRKSGSRLVIVKLIGVYRKSEEYPCADIESIHVETYGKPSNNSGVTEINKVSLRMKDNKVIPLDETADVNYVERLVTSICQVSGIARS